MKKNNLLLVYETGDKKEIKRVYSPEFIPRLGDEINFDCTESNLISDKPYKTYTVKNVAHIVPNVVVVKLKV